MALEQELAKEKLKNKAAARPNLATPAPASAARSAAAGAVVEEARQKLDAEVVQLREALRGMTAKLRDSEKESARLQDELDAKKRSSGSAETARLQVRVASLQQKCAEAAESCQKVKAENKRFEAEIQRQFIGNLTETN